MSKAVAKAVKATPARHAAKPVVRAKAPRRAAKPVGQAAVAA